MRNIKKGIPPADFEAWKAANQPKSWDDDLKNEPVEREAGIAYFSKNLLRQTLVKEQGGLCCYCQQRIDFSEKTKIEHFFPKDGADKNRGKALMFDYQNLLAACHGGDPEKGIVKPRQLHCNSSKKEQEIRLGPLEDCESRLQFIIIGDGKVEVSPVQPDDLDAEHALKILGLNCPKIQNLWGKAIKGLIYSDAENEVYISKEEAAMRLKKLDEAEIEPPSPVLDEFFGIKRFFLRQLAS